MLGTLPLSMPAIILIVRDNSTSAWLPITDVGFEVLETEHSIAALERLTRKPNKLPWSAPIRTCLANDFHRTSLTRVA